MPGRVIGGLGQNLKRFGAGLLLSSLMSSPAAAEMAPAGTLIRNVAEAIYFNEATGLFETVRSNEVTAIVLEAPALDVAGGTTLRLSRGAVDAQYFTVSNTGNAPVDFTLDTTFAGDTDALQPRGVFIDLNENGIVDFGEPEVTGPVTLEMGDDLSLISTFRVAPDATPGDLAQIALTALPLMPVDGVLTASGEVRVLSRTLELGKAAATADTPEGTLLTYTLNLRNDSEETVPGYSDLDGAPLLIDGAPVTGILVRDAIPVGTVFTSFGETGGFTAIYHLRGEPVHDYRSAPPASPGDIDAIAFFRSGDYAVGASTDLGFSVLVPRPVATTEVANTALTYVPDALGDDEIPSNTVTSRIDAAFEASLEFRSVGSALPQSQADIGTDTTLWFEAGVCNRTDVRDRVEIVVTSRITGDSERVTAVETAANSGVFATGPLALVEMDFPETMDGVMATANGDTLLAVAECDGATATADLPVVPGLFVFDSATNAPIEGAVITLFNGSEVAIATETSDENGYFTLGDRPAGDYRFEIGLPEGYSFPSVRSVFSGFERDVDADGSYGYSFTHAGGHIDGVDIPVDPRRSVPLTLEKTAGTDVIGPGGQVLYTVRAENRMDQALIDARIEDVLPARSRILPGTVTIDGIAAADPAEPAPGVAVFELGDLSPGQTAVITYRLQFTAIAEDGPMVNVATLGGYQAGTGLYFESAPARATVLLDASGSVLSREATIIGSVFMDCNGDGIRNGEDEPGVPGVKIITQQGISVVTDIYGKYSIVGLRAKSHVLSVRTATLPEDTEVTLTRTLDLGRSGTRLVPLRKGELVAEHFALQSCTPETLAEVADRVEAFKDRSPTASDLRGDLPLAQSNADRRSARNEAGIATTTQILRGAKDEKARTAPAPSEEAPKTLEDVVTGLTSDTGFLNLRDGETLRRAVVSIRVKSKADLTLSLTVNGTELGDDRIGEKTTWQKGNVQAAEFVAVRLKPGANTLVLSGKDPFGIVRDKEVITVIAPGEPARLQLVAPETAMAASTGRVPVVVSIRDAGGRAVEASGVVTLSARASTWDAPDIRPDTPGLQVYVDKGEATFDLIPPQVAGPDTLTAESSFGKATARITFTPDLQERILVGIVEGAVSLNGRGDLIEQGEISVFEETAEGLNGELYFKGRIRGDALLTLRYSSDRDTSDRLFRDIRRDEYYPVYGDNAEHGFDAQSSTNLYVKVEKGQSYVLYGDIAIEPEMPAFRLGGESRLTTGAKAHWEGERTRVTVFAARTDQSQRVSEVAGLGISGPYPVDLSGFREGSDRVELLVRDRDSDEVIASQRLRRFDDYVLDFFSNTILFDNPVPLADIDGNPVSIRVTIETSDGGERHWLYGGEIGVTASDTTEIGLRTIVDDAPAGLGQRSRVTALALRSQLDANTTFEAEVANASSETGGQGTALRFSLEQIFDDQSLLIEASHTDRGFAAEGSAFRAGTDRITLEFSKNMSEAVKLGLGIEYLSDRIAGTRTVTSEVVAENQVDDLTETRAGVRFERDLVTGTSTVQGLAGATWRSSEESQLEFRVDVDATTHGEASSTVELGVTGTTNERLSFTGLARIAGDRGRGFDRIEHVAVGIDYDLTDWLSSHSEIAADETGLGRYLGKVTQGLHARWNPSEESELHASIEHYQPVSEGEGTTSISLGADYLSSDDRSMASAALERSWQPESTTTYASLALAERINEDLTYLWQVRYADEAQDGQPDNRRLRARFGGSYRPKDDPRLELLAWYELQREKREVTSLQHQWSLQGTYEVDADTRLNARYSGLYSETSGTSLPTSSSLTQLAQIGASFDLADDSWLLGVNASHIWDDAGFSTTALGAEIGYAFAEDALLTFGYSDARTALTPGDYLSSGGLYFRVNIVLSEDLLSEFQEFVSDN